MSSGGTASNTVIDARRCAEPFGGAVSGGGTTINSGGTLEIGSGYTISGFTVSSGQTLEIASGGSASNTTVLAGGTP